MALSSARVKGVVGGNALLLLCFNVWADCVSVSGRTILTDRQQGGFYE